MTWSVRVAVQPPSTSIMDSTTLKELRLYHDADHCEFTHKLVFAGLPSEDDITQATLLVTEAIAAPVGQPEPHVFWVCDEDEQTLAFECAYVARCRAECIEDVYDACSKEACWEDTGATKRVLSNTVQRQLKVVTKGAVGKGALLNFLLKRATTADGSTGKLAWTRDSLPVFNGLSLSAASAGNRQVAFKAQAETFTLLGRGRYGEEQLNESPWQSMHILFSGAFITYLTSMFDPCCCVLVCYAASGQANCLSEQDGKALPAPGWPRSGKRHGKVRKYY